jgi:hypothetical protein
MASLKFSYKQFCVASYNVPENVYRMSHIFDHYLHLFPEDVLCSVVCSKLCRNCQMHADREPRFTEQMKAAVSYFALFLQSRYGSLLRNRHYETVPLGL